MDNCLKVDGEHVCGENVVLVMCSTRDRSNPTLNTTYFASPIRVHTFCPLPVLPESSSSSFYIALYILILLLYFCNIVLKTDLETAFVDESKYNVIIVIQIHF